MKQLYVLSLCMLVSLGIQAQANQAISGCNDPNGGIQILFDLSKNCMTAPGSLAGMSNIGFHSGMNGWQNVVDWNNPSAAQGVNTGNNIFRVYLANQDAYYSAAPGTVTQINFVFNQGPADGANPWSSEGKDRDNNGDGNCDDFFIAISSITTTCATSASVEDALIDLQFSIAPNPFDNKTVITFANPNNERFDIELTSLDGQVLRRIPGVTTNTVELEKGNLAPGMYFARFRNEAGKFATAKVIVK